MSLVKFAATCLVAAAIPQVLGKGFSQTVLAQSGDTPNAFPIPDTLPEDTTLTVDGSTSMRLTNEAFESLFEQQFSNVDVRLEASRTDEAFQALIDGDVDILASGRPLTEAEQAQGVAELPLEREKLAVILGPDNPFEGDLTFEQFARIFRGEITSWAEVGGPDVPIRFVDRPDYSDTRRALSTYTVFEGQPFATGSTGDPVAEDETDAVVEALGADGIGYGVVSQVIDRDDVRIIPMHQTLPDDPRYPYSQYRAFAYREEASPAVLAFLGLATAAPGVGATGDTSLDPSAVVGTVSSDSSDENGAENTALPDTSAAGDLDAEDPDALSQTAPDTALSDGEDIASAGAAPASEADFPWWLLWLLAIPLLGGLLWWLLKGNRSAAPPPAPADAAGTDPAIAPAPAATPINAAGASPAIAPATAASPPAPADAAGTDPAIAPAPAATPINTAGANPAIAPATAAVPAGIAAVGAAAAAVPAARMVLTPRNAKSAYAQWEIPQEQLAAAKRQGGETMMVRLYDVTDREPSLPLPTPAAEFVCMESNSDLHLPITIDNRSYCAEVGYMTPDSQWLPMAQSAPVRMPALPDDRSDDGELPGIGAVGGALGGAAIAAGAALGATKLAAAQAAGDPPGQIALTPGVTQEAEAVWDIPVAAKTALKAQGGEDYQLRLYDVTDGDRTAQPPSRVETYGLLDDGDGAESCTVSLPNAQRDYLAEVGYQTASGDWLVLARSAAVRRAADLSQSIGAFSAHGTTAAVAGGLAAAAALRAQQANPSQPDTSNVVTRHQGSLQTVSIHHRHHAVPLDAGQLHHLKNTVASVYRLEPGSHILRLRDGVFNYDGDDNHPGEPFVLLLIQGDSTSNPNPGTPMGTTWATLNGYADTLTLDVQAPATIHAFFTDTYPDDNTGEVTLSIIRL